MAFQEDMDLPPSLACLKNVDTLLRCPICFDYFSISMMTKCSHNFCSLCIRKYLSYKLQCPVCNIQMTEADLKNNRLLDDLVKNFQSARQQLSKAHFDSPPISPQMPSSAVKCKTPKERSQKCKSSDLSNFFQKKPRAPSKKEALRDSNHRKAPGANSTNLNLGEGEISLRVKEPMDTEYRSIQGLMPVKQEETILPCMSSVVAHSSSPLKDVKPVIKVECPVCSLSVSQQYINKHLDTCLIRGEKKESLRSSFGQTRRPMTKLVYNLLSVQDLKRRLKECHLSVQGSRDQLIRRHQDFVHLYNAQCDSLNPKSVEDVAKEVEANEKTRNQLQAKTKPVMFFSKNQSEKEIEEMHSNYRKQHSSDFSRLIAQVQYRLETTRQESVKREANVGNENAERINSADQYAESKNCLVEKIDDQPHEEEQSATAMELPSSPASSDVSISSSISDIFGPEADISLDDIKWTAGQKRSSRETDAALSTAAGKRHCRRR
ncbi:E3 ubiquitin-protein ligase RAD18 [Pholidichthys leucotaenia]